MIAGGRRGECTYHWVVGPAFRDRELQENLSKNKCQAQKQLIPTQTEHWSLSIHPSDTHWFHITSTCIILPCLYSCSPRLQRWSKSYTEAGTNAVLKTTSKTTALWKTTWSWDACNQSILSCDKEKGGEKGGGRGDDGGDGRRDTNHPSFITPAYFPFLTTLKCTVFPVCLAKEVYPVLCTQFQVRSIEKLEKSNQNYANFM